jgi:hypothetical protein
MINTNNRNSLLILIVSTVAVLFWVGFELARSYYLSTTPEIVEEQMRALNPKIDTAVLEQLSQRWQISDQALQETLDKNNVIYNPPTLKQSTGSASTNLNPVDNE